jgi:hypothetical protein
MVLAMLVLATRPAEANVTFSWKANSADRAVTVGNQLSNNHLRFIVTSGRMDSALVKRSDPQAWGFVGKDEEGTRVTTFSGDESRESDFYKNALDRYLDRELDLNVQTIIESRTEVGGRELLTVAIDATGFDSTTGQSIRYGQAEVEFFGSDDLQVEQITSPQQLMDITRSESPNGFSKLGMRSALDTGAPEYLIVTGSTLVEAFAPLLQWKAMKGLTAETVTMDEVLAMSTGVDDAEKLRNFLIEKYNAGTKYVLLGGDETIVPIRYAFAANTTSTPTIDLLQVCDLYFADVDGVWDADGDGVYGEPTQDSADLNADILLGRLPLCTPEQVGNYVSKLIAYEKNPNNGNFEYLNKSLFVAADQMRDYSGGVGEHTLLAQSLPSYVTSDTSTLIEAPSGLAENPEYPIASSSTSKLSEGWGIMSLLIHGRVDGWVIRSNKYNQWPKSFVLTTDGADDNHGFFSNIASDGMPGLVYSVGCNNGAFDMDTPPFPSANPSVATAFLAKPNGGAVAFVGYSRWGWVATSWQIEQAFLEYLYTVNNNPAEALRYAKLQSTFYRDECYGLNFNGDPEMKIWTDVPQSLSLAVPDALPDGATGFEVAVQADSLPLADAMITVMRGDSIVAQLLTDGNGVATIPVEFNFADTFRVCAMKEGFAAATEQLNPQIVLDVDDDDDVALPKQFTLHQNYPNPFNPTTVIAFEMSKPATVTVEIYNVLGEKVKTAPQGQVIAGHHQFEWNGSDDSGTPVSSGMYFARVSADECYETIKMCLMK